MVLKTPVEALFERVRANNLFGTGKDQAQFHIVTREGQNDKERHSDGFIIFLPFIFIGSCDENEKLMNHAFFSTMFVQVPVDL